MQGLFLALLLCSAAAHAHDGSADKRWNLVVVMTDDQAHWTIGAYGNRQCPTPNMDRLAREGALFTNAFSVAPLCSPSRATFLTGLYPTQAGVSDVLYWTLIGRAQARCPLRVSFLSPPFKPCVRISRTRLTDGLLMMLALLLVNVHLHASGRTSPRQDRSNIAWLRRSELSLAAMKSLRWSSRAFSVGLLDLSIMP